MRLVIDLQGAQGSSHERGIGRYSRELAAAMARAPRGHEVVVALSDEAQIVSILAHRDIDGLGLMPGAAVVVLIQAGDIVLVQGDGLRTSARNRIPGRVSGREDGAVNSEISLNIGGAKTLVATVTLESARALDLTPGAAVTALVKAPHVILATET